MKLLLLLLFSASSLLAGKIVYPWRATTAIVKAGETFEVWFNASSGQNVNTVELQSPYLTVVASKSVVNGTWVYDHESGNTYNRKITVTVPSTAPADRYDLILKTTAGNELSKSAVKVIKQYKDMYYIVHMSDVHRWQSESSYPIAVTLQKVAAVIDAANIIGAEMIFETGDHHYNWSGNSSGNAERLNIMFDGTDEWSSGNLHGSVVGVKGLNDASAATFLVPGNHDSPSKNYNSDPSRAVTLDWYNGEYGLAYYNFKYGNGRFMGFNSGMGSVPTAQRNAASSWLSSVGNGNFRLGAGHAGQNPVNGFDSATNLNMVLAGHNHFLASTNPHSINGKSIQYVANSIRDTGTGNFECNIFRVNNSNGQFQVLGSAQSRVHLIENHTASNINNPSSWVPMLERTYNNSNNGSSTSTIGTIKNRHNFAIPDAQLRFIVPKGNTYKVSKGTITQAFDGTSVRVVDVSVDLAANSTTNVQISVDSGGQVTLPVVSFASPTTTLTAGSNLELTVNATDPDGIDRVYLYKNGVQLVRSEGGAPYDFGKSGQGDSELANLPQGVYTFKAVAKDTLGHEGEASVIVTVNAAADTTAPVVSSITVSPTGTLYAGASIELTVSASDANGIDRVYMYKDGVQFNRSEGGAPYNFGQSGQGDTELANLPVGVYSFRAVAQDPAGNAGEATITVTINAIPDTVNPVVSFLSPTTTIVAGENLELSVDATDSGGISVVRLYKDGVQLTRTEGGAPYDFGQSGQGDTELANLAEGVYEFRAVAEDLSGNLGEATIFVSVVNAADSLKIEAEDFDVNVGYQTQATTDVGGGLNLAYANTGDYVDYDISVVSSGTYEVIFRVASATAGVKFDLKSGSTVLCNVNEPATGGSQTWVTTAPKVISLPAGNTTLRIVANGNSWNLNWFELIPLNPQDLFVEAEDFDVNSGFQTQTTTDIGGGLNLGFTDIGDYVDYGINLAAAGPYEVIFRVASATQGAKFNLTDGTNVFCSVNQAATGGFQTWVTTAPKGINLPAGNTNLRILATGHSWNMNWFELLPYNGGVSIEAEDFDSTVGFGTQSTSDFGGGGNLKDASTGDTATYLNVNIPVSGTYQATFRIASLNQPVRFALKNGSTTLVTVDQPATGGYQTWTSWATSGSNNIHLSAGTITLTIEANGNNWNLNWFDLKLVQFD